MKLSVAIIEKNEEKNIRRLLDSLMPIKKEISMEIIIIDTGSIDNSINIAREYTDKIYSYKWNDDFAQARNVSISYCTGEWILILDADEEIDDYAKLIEFLNNDSNNVYNTCEIICRSYGDTKLKTYADCGLYRLFRNNTGFHYEGRIHEQPIVIEPVISTDIVINHYGYMNDDIDLVINKYERNMKLLQEDLHNNIRVDYTRYQIYQTYSFINKRIEAMQVIKAEYNKNNEYSNIINYVRELYSNKEYSKAIEVLSYIKDKYNYIDVDFYLGISYYYNKNYKKAINKFYDYIEEYNTIQKGYDDKYKSIIIYSINFRNAVGEYLIKSLYYNEEYEKLLEVYNREKNTMPSIRKKYIYSIIHLNKFKDEFNDNISEEDIEYIIEAIERYNSIGQEDYVEIIKNILGVNKKLDYILNKIYLHNNIENECNIDYKIFYSWKAKLLNELIKDSNKEIFVLKDYNSELIRKYLYKMKEDCYTLRELYKISRENIFEYDNNKLKIIVEVERMLLLSEYKDFYDYNKLIIRAGINSVNYTYKQYNKLFIDNNVENIDKYAALWIKLSKIVKEIDLAKYVEDIKVLLIENDEYSNILQAFVDMHGRYIITDDMIKERNIILDEAEKLINIGELNEALNILKELLQIFCMDEYILMDIGIIYYMLDQKEVALEHLLKAYYINRDNPDICYNLACILEEKGYIEASKYLYEKSN